MLSKMFDVAAYIVVHFHLHKVKACVYKSEYLYIWLSAMDLVAGLI